MPTIERPPHAHALNIGTLVVFRIVPDLSVVFLNDENAVAAAKALPPTKKYLGLINGVSVLELRCDAQVHATAAQHGPGPD